MGSFSDLWLIDGVALSIGIFLSNKDCDCLNTTAKDLRLSTVAFSTESIGPGLCDSDSDCEPRFNIDSPASAEQFKELAGPTYYGSR